MELKQKLSVLKHLQDLKAGMDQKQLSAPGGPFLLLFHHSLPILPANAGSHMDVMETLPLDIEVDGPDAGSLDKANSTPQTFAVSIVFLNHLPTTCLRFHVREFPQLFLKNLWETNRLRWANLSRMSS